MSIAFQYHDAVSQRLRDAGVSLANQHRALAVLWMITRHLAWQSFECDKTAADLVELTGIGRSEMSRTLDLLEKIGAIGRVKIGRSKVIVVTPEGAYRGNVHEHGKAVERYRIMKSKDGKMIYLVDTQGGQGDSGDAGRSHATPDSTLSSHETAETAKG